MTQAPYRLYEEVTKPMTLGDVASRDRPSFTLVHSRLRWPNGATCIYKLHSLSCLLASRLALSLGEATIFTQVLLPVDFVRL